MARRHRGRGRGEESSTRSTPCSTNCATKSACASANSAALLDSSADQAAGEAVRQLMFIERVAREIGAQIERLEQRLHRPSIERYAGNQPPNRTNDGFTANFRTRHGAGAASAARGGRHRSRHDQFAGRRRAQRRARRAARRRRPCAAAVGRALSGKGRPRASAARRRTKRRIDPRNTIVSVKRFMGRGKSEVEGAENAPYDFVDAPGMVQIRTVDGVKSPVEVSAEILATLRYRAEDTPRRRSGRRGDHRARVFRRSAAPGDQRRRASRGPERAAPPERADRGGDCLRSGQRIRRPLRRLRPRRRHLRSVDSEAHQGRVRSARGGRRFRARRRRFRSPRCIGMCSSRRASHPARPEDVRLLLDRVRAAKEASVGSPNAHGSGDACRPAADRSSTVDAGALSRRITAALVAAHA